LRVETKDIVFLFFGAVLIYAPFEMLRDRRKKQLRSAITSGRVIGHENKVTVGMTSNEYRPDTKHAVIEYEVDRKRYKCTSSIGATFIVYPEGSYVKVCYDPRDPARADILAPLWENRLEKALILCFPLIGLALLGYGLFKFFR
jgi:hypothetical protein